MKKLLSLALTVLALTSVSAVAQEDAAAGERVFEMRTYHCNEGKLEALNSRFREHTNYLFVKHGMSIIGFWTPNDQPDTLIYILAYPNREARDASWEAFQSDEAWRAAYEASVADGRLVARVDSVFMKPTDYSPIH